MMWPGYGWNYGVWWWLMPLGMVLFWGLVIWGVVMLVRRGGHGCCSTSGSQHESALDILKRRYASGEIGKEEFEEKRRLIN